MSDSQHNQKTGSQKCKKNVTATIFQRQFATICVSCMFLLILAPTHGVFWCIFTTFTKISKSSVNLNEKRANLGLILVIFDGFEPIFKSKTTPFFQFSSIWHHAIIKGCGDLISLAIY